MDSMLDTLRHNITEAKRDIARNLNTINTGVGYDSNTSTNMRRAQMRLDRWESLLRTGLRHQARTA